MGKFTRQSRLQVQQQLREQLLGWQSPRPLLEVLKDTLRGLTWTQLEQAIRSHGVMERHEQTDQYHLSQQSSQRKSVPPS